MKAAASCRTPRAPFSSSPIATFFFADVLFLGNNFWFRDLFVYHFPMKRVVRETIARGEFPWWNPYFAGGQPMIANPAYEIFYPPQWLIFVGSFPFGFALHIVFHVYVALLGMLAFLRSIPLRIEAAMFGALSFGLSGFFLGAMTNLPTFFVWSRAGVVGWGTLRLIRQRRIAPAAVALALPMLVLEPIAVALMLLLVVIGTLWVDRRAALRVLSAIGIAAAIAAVVIIPAIDHARDSARSRGFRYDVVTDYSMPPARPLELIAPRAFGVLPELHNWWGYRIFGWRGTPYFLSLYCGVAVAILALAGVVTRQRGSALVLTLGAISYALAIGSHTPIFQWLYGAGFRSIRYPEKFVAAGLITLIIFAAMTADRIAEIRRAAVTVALIVGGALWIAAAAMTPAIFTAIWNAPSGLASLARVSLVVAALLASTWAAVLWRTGASRVWTLAALALLLFDLGSLSNEVVPRMSRQFLTPPPIVNTLDRDSTIFHRGEWTQQSIARVYERISPAWLMRNGLRPYSAASWGLRGALEGDFDETDLLPTHDLLNAMIRRGNSGDPHWSEAFIAMSNVRYILDYQRSSIEQPVTVTPVANRGRFWFARGEGRILRLRETSSSASLDVQTNDTALLVITITRHKYWRATLDGRTAPLIPANFAYQSLTVPPGTHRIELRYRNPVVLWGGAVSALALIALIAEYLLPRSAWEKVARRAG